MNSNSPQLQLKAGTQQAGLNWVEIVETQYTLQPGIYYVFGGASTSAISSAGIIGLRLVANNETIFFTRVENIVQNQVNRIHIFGRAEIEKESKLQLQFYHNTSSNPWVTWTDIVVFPITKFYADMETSSI